MQVGDDSLVFTRFEDQHYGTFPLLLRDGPGVWNVFVSIQDKVGDDF